MKQKQIWIITIAIIVFGLGLWWLIYGGQEATAPATMNDELSELPTDDPNVPIPEGSATNQLANGDAIVVTTQSAGSFVNIDNYVLSQNGFIVIHEARADGSAGNIVGNSGYLSAGRGQDLEFNLNLVAGRSYVAMLHADNGDRTFNASVDLPILENNRPVMTLFRVQ
ncbi:MAG TPA: hypothetical protein PKD79_01160 [Candidatus Doudnabacteria bacterium]|nr:hypothetical protein [Candidatus Doudnabacteria bacterium]